MSRILILDDEMLIALDLAMTLEDEGYTVCGPFNDVESALSAIEDEAPDGALLDVNLGGGKTSTPVADRLADRVIPFAFLTGYEKIADKLELRLRSYPRLGKPFDRTKILAVLNDMLRA